MVKKFKKGERFRTIRRLYTHEIISLQKIAGSEGKISGEENKQLKKFLCYLRENELWIQCSCRKYDNPILAIVRRGSSIFLRHINIRSKHNDKCPFKGVDYEGLLSKRGIKKIERKQHLNLHRKIGEVGEVTAWETRTSRPGSGSKQSKLSKLLYSLIDDAKINIISLPVDPIETQYQKIKAAASGYLLDNRLKLSEFFWTHPNQVNYAGYTLSESGKTQIFSKCRPYGVFVLAVDEYSGSTIKTKINNEEFEIKINGLMRLSSGRIGYKGPFIVIFTMAGTVDNPGYVIPFKGFLQPILSKRLLVPVDSSHERRIIKSLLGSLSYWKEEKGFSGVRIKKPLFGYDEKDCDLKPDIILEYLNRQILIEVQGSCETDYLERKKRVHERMKSYGPMVALNAYLAETNGSWKQELSAFYKKILVELYKIKKLGAT